MDEFTHFRPVVNHSPADERRSGFSKSLRGRVGRWRGYALSPNPGSNLNGLRRLWDSVQRQAEREAVRIFFEMRNPVAVKGFCVTWRGRKLAVHVEADNCGP